MGPLGDVDWLRTGITDVVSFQAESVADLRTAFEEAVDDYLDAYKRLGQTPQ